MADTSYFKMVTIHCKTRNAAVSRNGENVAHLA